MYLPFLVEKPLCRRESGRHQWKSHNTNDALALNSPQYEYKLRLILEVTFVAGWTSGRRAEVRSRAYCTSEFRSYLTSVSSQRHRINPSEENTHTHTQLGEVPEGSRLSWGLNGTQLTTRVPENTDCAPESAVPSWVSSISGSINQFEINYETLALNERKQVRTVHNRFEWQWVWTKLALFRCILVEHSERVPWCAG